MGAKLIVIRTMHIIEREKIRLPWWVLFFDNKHTQCTSCTLYCDDDDGDSARITYYYTPTSVRRVFLHTLHVIIIIHNIFTRKQIESDRRCSHLDSRAPLIIIFSTALLGPVSGDGRTDPRDIYTLLSCVGKKKKVKIRGRTYPRILTHYTILSVYIIWELKVHDVFIYNSFRFAVLWKCYLANCCPAIYRVARAHYYNIITLQSYCDIYRFIRTRFRSRAHPYTRVSR